MTDNNQIEQSQNNALPVEPANTNAVLYYNTRPIFFTHNSVDQIHPLDLNRYFTWTALPNISLNWISQTEATINLSVDGITQFKLTNWFHFGDVYFNVMSYKMISKTDNRKVYQYHLKMNIHNTFLPRIFQRFGNYGDRNIYVNRISNLGGTTNLVRGLGIMKKIDPALDFKNKSYCLVSSCMNVNTTGGFRTKLSYQSNSISGAKEMPLLNPTLSTGASNGMYFVYDNNTSTGTAASGSSQLRYKTIKWYVWKNPRNLTYILIPSVAERELNQLVKVSPFSSSLVSEINVATGVWKSSNTTSTFICHNNDEQIEKVLVNGSTQNTDFANQSNFIGAFFGPAISGGEWTIYKALNSNNQYVCVMLENNIDTPNNSSKSVWNSRVEDNAVKYQITKIYTPHYMGVSSGEFLEVSWTVGLTSSINHKSMRNYWILSNMSVAEHAYKVLHINNENALSIIAPTNFFINNNFTIINPWYVSPFGTFTFNYPQQVHQITDAYKQYLNSVRNAQDTSINIAKQQMDLNISKNVLSGIGGATKAAAGFFNPFNLLNPASAINAAGGVFNSISGAATGIASEVLAYENKQKEIDAANLDKQNSTGATVYSSSVNDSILNMMYARGTGKYEYYVYTPNQSDKVKIKLPLMYWSSYIGRLPFNAIDLFNYNTYLFWNGVYVGSSIPLEYFNLSISLSGMNSTNNAGFIYVDFVLPDDIINATFGGLNMSYREAIKTVVNNGMRLYFAGYTPSSLRNQFYELTVRGDS